MSVSQWVSESCQSVSQSVSQSIIFSFAMARINYISMRWGSGGDGGEGGGGGKSKGKY
jgi:hypothetical protein